MAAAVTIKSSTGSDVLQFAENILANIASASFGGNEVVVTGGNGDMLVLKGDFRYFLGIPTYATLKGGTVERLVLIDNPGAKTVATVTNLDFDVTQGLSILKSGSLANFFDKAGSITFTGNSGDDISRGSSLADNLSGGGGNDTIRARDGKDLVEGGAGGDNLDGGADIDTLSYRESLARVKVSLTGKAEGGDARGDEVTGFENLIGSDFNDVLSGNALHNVIDGGKGDDVFLADASGDRYLGGAGLDTVDFAASTAVRINLELGRGKDGLAEEDAFIGIENVNGSAGSDLILGDLQANVLNGSNGDDRLLGGSGADTLAGGADDDSLLGGTGGDALSGGTGNDTVEGGAGSDDLDGGQGGDTLSYQNSTGSVIVTLDGASSGGDANGDTNSGFENLIGSNGNDSLTGNADANEMNGGDGNDVLRGEGGADVLIGGSGLDTADYSGSGSGVTVNLLGGKSTGGFADGDSLKSVENLRGSDAADKLAGNGLSNLLSGALGDDTLSGGGETDTLLGGGGKDVLAGGDGKDELGGGSGSDTFVLSNLASSADIILDFTSGKDLLEIDASLFKGGLVAGDELASSRVEINDTGLASTSQTRFVLDTSTGTLVFDSNGSTGGTNGSRVIAHLEGNLSGFSAGDFMIV